MILYSIANDVDSRDVNIDKLQTEIIASGLVIGFSGLQVQEGTIGIQCEDTLDKVALDLLIKNHVPKSLNDLKIEKKLTIDTKTRAIIARGFTFDGNQFSLSSEAQINWLGLITLQNLFTFPIGVTNNNDNTYMMDQGSLIPFVATASSVIATAIGEGRALKVQVNAAVDQAGIDAVVDSR